MATNGGGFAELLAVPWHLPPPSARIAAIAQRKSPGEPGQGRNPNQKERTQLRAETPRDHERVAEELNDAHRVAHHLLRRAPIFPTTAASTVLLTARSSPIRR